MGNESSNSNTHVANATGKHLRIFYKVDKMKLEEMVVYEQVGIGGTASKIEPSLSGNMSISVRKVFKPNTDVHYFHLPQNETCNIPGQGAIHASVLLEDEKDENICSDVICLNFPVPHDRSFIVTANYTIKMQKYGAGLWIDEDGINHRPY